MNLIRIKSVYVFLNWLLVATVLIFCIAVLKSGGNFVRRVKALEERQPNVMVKELSTETRTAFEHTHPSPKQYTHSFKLPDHRHIGIYGGIKKKEEPHF